MPTEPDEPDRHAIAEKLLRFARTLDEGGDHELSKALRDARWLLIHDERESPVVRDYDLEMRHRQFTHIAHTDNVRHVVAIALIVVLFAVILAGIFTGATGEEISQFAAPVSGLAGIAIGWLFSNRDGLSS